ncbi:MAG: type II toxin-antitoxin system HicB family antitoxin [Oscillospiraceae bacterium]|nr:type II toxin-antitoxin system HicB family antitoxin [Oscillospiraceae bacterium]
MKKYTFSVLIEKDEDGDGFIATVPELKGCHTQGDTVTELLANVREAIELCVEVAENDNIDVFNRSYYQTQTVEMVI